MSNPTFFLPASTIDNILYTDVHHIAATLVLARYTDKTGQYSTAGRSAIKRNLGIGTNKADRILVDLQRWKIITPPETKPKSKASTRFIFPAGDERVWFNAGIVDGYGQWKRPLKDLCVLGKTAAQWLLHYHRIHDMAAYGGIPPQELHQIYEIDGEEPIQWNNMAAQQVRKIDRLSHNYNPADHNINAIRGLMRGGWMYEVATVMNGDPNNPGTIALYHLHTFNKHGRSPKGERGLASKTANACPFDSSANHEGKFDGRTFAIITPDHITNPQVAGIYRLRWRAVNTKSSESRFQWYEVKERQRQGEDWINTFAS